MMQLDLFEGVSDNCYRRELVQVTSENGEVLPSVVYIGQAFTNEPAYPSESYWNAIRTGAQEHQLAIDYVDALRQLAEESI